MKRAFPGSSFRIGEHRIGSGSPAFVIAEIGINHNGDLKLALDLIDAAVECRVDAVKFQTLKPRIWFLPIVNITKLSPRTN